MSKTCAATLAIASSPSASTSSLPAVTEPPEIVLFDIDGTLIDTGGAGAEAWNFGFKQRYGSECDIGKFTEDGMTDPVIAKTLIQKVKGIEDPPAADVSKLLQAYAAVLPD